MKLLLARLASGIFVLALAACETTSHTPDDPEASTTTASFDAKVARLKIGMTKDQIIAVMGDNYHSAGTVRSSRGTTEQIMYTPSFGTRIVTSMKREYSLGHAGRQDSNSVLLQMEGGRLKTISKY